MRVLKGKAGSVTALAFSPDGATLAACTSGRVTLWDVAKGTGDTRDMGISGAPLDNLRFDPSGRWLLMAFGLQRGLHVMKVPTREAKQVGKFDANRLAVSPTGQVLVGRSEIRSFEVTEK